MKTNKKIFSVIALIFLLLNSHSQNPKLDSLVFKLQKSAEDTNKVFLLAELAAQYHQSDPYQALNYGKEAIALSKKINYKKGEAMANGNMGLVYKSLGDYAQATEYYFEAIRLYEETGVTRGVGIFLNNIGNIKREQNKLDEALRYFNDAFPIVQYWKDSSMIANVFNNIGGVYQDKKEYDKALDYFFKTLAMDELSGDKRYIAQSNANIGTVYYDMGNLEKALEYLNKSLQMRQEINDEYGIASSLRYLGFVFIKMKKYSNAIDNFQRSADIAKKIHNKKIQRFAYEGLATAYSGKGDFQKAFHYHQLLSEVKDSLLNEKNSRQISELEMQYQVGKKEQENILLAKENELQALTIQSEKDIRKNQFIILAGVIVFIVFVSLFFYTRYRYHHLSQMEEEKRRQEQLRFKMVIDAEEKERARIATELHDGLGHLLSTAKLNVSGLEDTAKGDERKLFDNSMNLIDEACNEVRTISHNLMPTALMRQGLISAIRNLVKKINDTEQIRVELKETLNEYRLDELTEIALYRIIQEILNNMLKHSQAKNIKIIFEKEKEKILLEVCDNGIGFNVSKIQASNGIGWKNIFSRVDIMSGIINIDSEKGKGTTVKIEIPV